MTPKSLKGKMILRYDYGEHTDHENIEMKTFNKQDIKSAVEGLIKFHEDRIEKWKTKGVTEINPVLIEKESIKAIKYWLEDVI